MCGIGGFVIRQPDRAANIDREAMLDRLLWTIDHRGGDATGFVARAADGATEWHKAGVAAGDFIPYRRALPPNTVAVLAHTRFATQGHHGFPENNHPLRRGSFYVVHNGHVTNDAAVFAATGRERYGQVDSEAIAAALSHGGSLSPQDAGPELERLRGAVALAALDERDGTVLLARVDSSPLWVLETRRAIVWGSTEAACRAAHLAGIGSLGHRKQPVWQEEGSCLTIHPDGTVTRWQTAVHPRPSRKVWLPSKDAASYVPSPHITRWDTWEEDLLVPASPLATLRDECELCRQPSETLMEMDDDGDTWHLCPDCHDTLRPFQPATYRKG